MRRVGGNSRGKDCGISAYKPGSWRASTLNVKDSADVARNRKVASMDDLRDFVPRRRIGMRRVVDNQTLENITSIVLAPLWRTPWSSVKPPGKFRTPRPSAQPQDPLPDDKYGIGLVRRQK
jgi:hypothetical protein